MFPVSLVRYHRNGMAASLNWCPWARKMCKDGLTLCFNGEVQIPLKNAEIHLNALMSCKFFWNSSKMLLEDWYVLIQLRHSWLHHLGPFIVRHLFYGKNLDVKKRHCRKYIVQVPWPFVLYRGSTELLLLMFFNYLTVVFQIGNPKLILQKFPSLGKFLGHLFENSVILLSGEISVKKNSGWEERGGGWREYW